VEISEIARLAKLGNVSDVAFMKRFENCNNWFKSILSNLVTDGAVQYQKPEWLKDYRVIAIDASDVTEKGRSGRLYHLHFALDIFKMESIQYKITTQQTGETFKNFIIEPDDLFIADRGYCSLNGIEQCIKCGGSFVIRVRKNCFKMYNAAGETIDILELLRSLSENDVLDLNVCALGNNNQCIPMRICAMRKMEDDIIAKQKKIRQKASKHQRVVSEEAKEFSEYIVLVTNLPERIIGAQVLELYRLRWQVEIYFKRLKSIMNFGELPKRRSESVMAWLNGKIMIALLIEKIIGRENFSPSGEYCTEYMA
jgi:hypothetical protein